MPREYSPRQFLRLVPKALLQRYFADHGLLIEFDWESLPKRDIEPLYQAWLGLPEEARDVAEMDFREIHAMACDGGFRAIADEARFHEDPNDWDQLIALMAAMENHHARACWAFLNRPACWMGAQRFLHADRIPESRWKRRKNVPQREPAVDDATINLLAQQLGDFFHRQDGRGRNCKIEVYRRQALEYFFVFAEDYAEAPVEWVVDTLKRRPRSPTFEVIFLYSPDTGTLDTYLHGARDRLPQLQTLFAKFVLGVDHLGDDARDERVYDLDPLLSRAFTFVFDSASGIQDVRITRLRLLLAGADKKQVTLEVSPRAATTVIYDLLDEIAKGTPLLRCHVNHARIRVGFAPGVLPGRSLAKSFELTSPNGCTLRHEGPDQRIRQMLVASKLEPVATLT
jgi:hypothetical protein